MTAKENPDHGAPTQRKGKSLSIEEMHELLAQHANGEKMELAIEANKIEFIYDELDTNAINFQTDDGYFSIQTCVYLEEDDELNKPQFELNDQGNSQNDGLESIIFSEKLITLNFLEKEKFIKKYKAIKIKIPENIDRKVLTDFFANHLFLGEYMEYDNTFDKSKITAQTENRDYL